jgi:replicative DNA helicase
MDVFNVELQKQLVAFMMADSESFAISRDIIRPELFDRSLEPAVAFILDYANQHSNLPPVGVLSASTGFDVPDFPDAKSHRDWYTQTIEKFIQKRTLTDVILNYAEKIQENKEHQVDIVKACQDAMAISLIKDLGTNIFKDADRIIENFKANQVLVPTGFNDIDGKLYGGLAEESLTIFVGRSGEGKSLILQNIGINWAAMGKNIIYISLELSEELIGRRLISMVSDLSTTDVLKNTKEACTRIKIFDKRKQAGNYIIKALPNGSTTNTIRAFIKEYTIKTGIEPDAIIVDYLDIMYPNEKNVDISNLFTKDKFVSEQLRGLSFDLKVPVVTASQFNRSATDTEEFDHSHIAGGISKINTADNLIYLNAPKSKKEKGEFEIIFGKTRSSGAVGDRLKLKYNNQTMRLLDWEGLPDVDLDFGDLDDDNDAKNQLMNLNL